MNAKPKTPKPKPVIRTSRQGEDNPKLKQLFEDGETMRVDLALVVRDELQPRSFDNVMDGIDEFAREIEKVGMIEVPQYRIMDDGTYQIVTGERRTTAARRLGWETILARVKRFDKDDLRKLRRIQYSENDPRYKRPLSPIDDAKWWRSHIDEFFEGSIEKAAEDVGVTANLVYKKLAILNANPELKTFINENIKDSSLACDLVSLYNDEVDQAKSWMREYLSGGLVNVRGSIKAIKREIKAKKKAPTVVKARPDAKTSQALSEKHDVLDVVIVPDKVRPKQDAVITVEGVSKFLLDEKLLLARVTTGDFPGQYLGRAFLSVTKKLPFELSLGSICDLDSDAYQLFFQILDLGENATRYQKELNRLGKKITALLDAE